ncbi:putative mitochondrial protein [Cucumis melo var. makuwa]|uniref:Mitochondrial protein n=1 Tax=Cucumis melo var. makuwa TaxID=1194695 RepID=A0A5D3E0R1_CUCMM|nr:putative mitochondrial protein [Cucumis melo var. makuwa]TYK29055.1 putative mitochondrial protein [Cucumis melo var. makuwa]
MTGNASFFFDLSECNAESVMFIDEGKGRIIGKGTINHPGLPTAAHLKMTKDTKSENVDPSLYQSIISSLLYLTASKSDIAFVVRVCARYQADPGTSHIHSAKRILKYITGTINYGLWYTFDITIVLVGYRDANWAGCSDDRKSTSGGYFSLATT